MNETAAIVCKAFLQKSPKEKSDRLVHFLSAALAQQLKDLPDQFYKDPTKGFEPLDTKLHSIHYSWFAGHLRNLSESEIGLFLAVLSEAQIAGLKKQLLFSNKVPLLSSIARPFLQKTLFDIISERAELIPKECIPDSPLVPLLEMEPKDLRTLIDLLGIHDLSVEVKQIIETAKLKEIDAALTTKERAFLKTLLHQKEPVLFKRIALQNWDRKPETLRSILQQRGLNRLAKALCSGHSTLLWYVSRRLEMELGQLLVKLATPLEQPRTMEILTSQVVELIPKSKRGL